MEPTCLCESGKYVYELLDYQGIYCGLVCEDCENEMKSRFNPWVFTGYDQAFLDEYSGERIEPYE